jgi:hypothetical protein
MVFLTWWGWLLVAVLIPLLISSILLRWPSLWYGQQSRHRHGPTYHGSHRGGLAERPENTYVIHHSSSLFPIRLISYLVTFSSI